MRPVRSAAVLACLALAACASHPTPKVPLPSAYEAPNPGGLPAEALDRWWTAFGDPKLTALVEQALAASPDARTAKAPGPGAKRRHYRVGLDRPEGVPPR